MKLIFFLFLLTLTPGNASAHQPRLVDQPVISVTDPEVSKAYYGELTGEPHTYKISAREPFDLYVNILEPDIEGQSKNTSAIIIRSNSPESKPYAMLDGMNFEWTRFWEEFGVDWYWKGPELKTHAEAGDYEIQVLNTMNHGKYVLAIGEIEAFNSSEIRNALNLIPTLKRDFFEESPINFILSPFGWGYLLAIYVVVLISGFLAHLIVHKLRKGKGQKSGLKLAAEHRVLLAGLGLCLLLWAMATTWNLVVIFLSGVCIFEASGIFPKIIIRHR